MKYVVVGLGNPGEEYKNTRHNIGRMVVELLAERLNASGWRDDKKLRAKISQYVTSNGDEVKLVLPDNYMNQSGGSVAPIIKNKKQAERLIVVHDDIDIGVGSLRIVFNRGSGGHRGVESIEKAIKTKSFIRVRIGVVPVSPTGKIRKPKGEDKVYNFILRNLSKKDKEVIDEIVKRSADAVESVLLEGKIKAMCEYNTDNDDSVEKKRKVVKKKKVVKKVSKK